MTRGEYGIWDVVIPAKDGQPAIPHNTKVKVWSSLQSPTTDANICAAFYGHFNLS